MAAALSGHARDRYIGEPRSKETTVRIRLALIGSLTLVIMEAALMGQTTQPASQPAAKTPAEKEFLTLYDAYIAKYEPLYRQAEKAWWDANVTGAEEAFARQRQAKNAIIELHHDKAVFEKLKALKDGGQVADPLVKRQLDVMYREFLADQADPEVQKRIVALETELEQAFNAHRSLVNGKELTENEVRDILTDTKDTKQAEAAWKGYMAVGAKVDEKLREVVRLRNQQAKQLGFRNFYSMQLGLGEIEEAELFKIFDELDALTAAPFAALKKGIDTVAAARFGVAADALRPWNYSDLFFQELPSGQEGGLEAVYEKQDLLALAKTYYGGLGLDVDGILKRSDLYEKPLKSSHAFCADLDRAGDIRVLANLKPNLYWADTLLHELGHAVYDEYVDPALPFNVRTAAHSITTEGVALMMGAMSKNGDYLVKVVKLPPEQAAPLAASARRALCNERLIFARWAQVMVRFEYAMYDKPDQDLGKLWWDLKKRYQLQNPPDDVSRPDYAAKNHIVTTPAYYHNYMFGDLFACQVQEHIAVDLLGKKDPYATCFYGENKVGAYLRDQIFQPGNRNSWNDLTKRATGEPLSAKAYAKQVASKGSGD
jgi:peptidyl-dipeptidase A